uniref:Uncharacterized protein n=1 Tax=Picea sitchensis TaxID=3332 RepID=D5A898_PICSI|nr:unknown [Picea sitchensis]
MLVLVTDFSDGARPWCGWRQKCTNKVSYEIGCYEPAHPPESWISCFARE